MHLHVLWDAIKVSRLMQAGMLLVILSGLAEACDQLGAVDMANLPYIGKYAPAILSVAGLAKISLRLAVLIIGAGSNGENKS